MKAVYTLSDLQHPERDPDNIFLRSHKPAKLAVIGAPVSHSQSPQLHQPVLDQLKINASYIRVHLSEEHFTEGVNLLKELGFIGCNVTVPHKERALQWATLPSPLSKKVGVANTLLFRNSSCHTTDPIGLQRAIQNELKVHLEQGHFLILGAAGGAGKAVAQHLAPLVKTLALHNRTSSKLTPLRSSLEAQNHLNITYHGNENFPPTEPITCIINATSLGLSPSDASPLPKDSIFAHHAIYDMTYGCQNALSLAATSAQAQYADGRSMLKYQGAESFKIWFPNETESDSYY